MRPTTDRVREAMFNSLDSAGKVRGARVLDLFAGTGACGIEALSRGAREVTFVDASPKACALVKANLELVKAKGDVVCTDAVTYAKRGGQFDIVIADPPYKWDKWPQLLDALNARFVICEASAEVEPTEGWVTTRSKRYGQTVMTFMEAGE